MFVRRVLGLGVATIGGLALAGSVLGGDRVRIYGATGGRLIEEKLESVAGTGGKLELLKTRVRELDGEVHRLRETAVAREVELDVARSRIRRQEGSIEQIGS